MPADMDIARIMLDFAIDAYGSHESDEYFHVGYHHADDHWYQTATRANWLNENRYIQIENPAGTSEATRYYGIIGISGSRLVVAFRGTTTWDDIAVDLKGLGIDPAPSDPQSPIGNGRIAFSFSTWNIGGGDVWTHQGFLSLYQSLQNSVRTTIKSMFDSNPSLRGVYVTGHSLGGAVATLCAIDLAVNVIPYDARIQYVALYAFASPLVGDQRLADLQKRLFSDCYRFEAANDLIPAVPWEGVTPEWRYWNSNGRIGPEPQELAPFVAVGETVPIPTLSSSSNLKFPMSHAVSNYGKCLGQSKPLALNNAFKATDPIESLSVTIHTANKLGAGTDNAVYAIVLGIYWGPLDSKGDDFERGSSQDYDLFAAFPSKVPPNPLVGHLTSIGLYLGEGPFDIFLFRGNWRPSQVELWVNDRLFASFKPKGWLTKWPPGGNTWNIPIDLSTTI